MDPIRIFVVLVALFGVGAFAFLAANSERQVDAGSAVGFLSEDVAAAERRSDLGGGPFFPDAGEAPGYAEGAEGSAPVFPDPDDHVRLTEDQWRERLSAPAFRVLREDGTERAFTSPLDGVKEPGWFTCAGCGNLLFETNTKFDSGTGWPSFWEPVSPRHIVEEAEGGFLNRIEVSCARCEGHLGHVFRDGPREKTGLRYCMNGVAMAFTPKPAADEG